MGARHADRLWMIAGAAVIAVLALVSWFLLISPEKTDTADLRAQTETARTQAVDIRKRIATLKKQSTNLGKLKATLAGYQDALPADSGVPAFLRQLQAAGTDLDVDVSGITVSSPSQLPGLPGVWALPIQLTAQGPAENLGTFLDELQGARQAAIQIAADSMEELRQVPAANVVTWLSTRSAQPSPTVNGLEYTKLWTSSVTVTDLLNVTVRITWKGNNCPSAGCTYATGTQISTAFREPVFNSATGQ